MSSFILAVGFISHINQTRLSLLNSWKFEQRQESEFWMAEIFLIESSQSHRHRSSSPSYLGHSVVCICNYTQFSRTSVSLRWITLMLRMIWIDYIYDLTAQKRFKAESQRLLVWELQVIHRRAQRQWYIMFHTATWIRIQCVLGQHMCSVKQYYKHIFNRDSFWLRCPTYYLKCVAQGHGGFGIIILNFNLQACDVNAVLRGALMEPKVQIFLSRTLMGWLCCSFYFLVFCSFTKKSCCSNASSTEKQTKNCFYSK